MCIQVKICASAYVAFLTMIEHNVDSYRHPLSVFIAIAVAVEAVAIPSSIAVHTSCLAAGTLSIIPSQQQ